MRILLALFLGLHSLQHSWPVSISLKLEVTFFLLLELRKTHLASDLTEQIFFASDKKLVFKALLILIVP